MEPHEMIYMRAARGERPETMPIVIEIQMVVCPEFKALHKKHGFEGICKNAELSAQCTVMPINDLGFDAAIHMSDALIPVEAMGVEVQHTIEGPRVAKPVRTLADVAKLVVPEPEEGMAVWLEATRMAKKELSGKVPLIGWIASPLSSAYFLVEGGLPIGPNQYHRLKKMMYSAPEVLHALLEKLTAMYLKFVQAQIAAGADVMMLLDLRVPTALNLADYMTFDFPYLKKIIDVIKTRSAPIFFAADGATFLQAPLADAGIDIIGTDWTVEMETALKHFGSNQVVQGNLDPYCLFAPDHVIEQKVRELVEAGKAAPAHIFSLGGWMLLDTPFEKTKFLVELVHSL